MNKLPTVHQIHEADRLITMASVGYSSKARVFEYKINAYGNLMLTVGHHREFAVTWAIDAKGKATHAKTGSYQLAV